MCIRYYRHDRNLRTPAHGCQAQQSRHDAVGWNNIMLIHNFRTCSLVCLTLLAVSSAAFSQGLQSDRSFWGNHYSPDGGNEASFPAWLPLTESENIESDFQWFAPGEFG